MGRDSSQPALPGTRLTASVPTDTDQDALVTARSAAPDASAYAGWVFKPNPALVQALRDLFPRLDGGQELTAALDLELLRRRPDLTDVLIRCADLALTQDVELSRTVTAAVCRAACVRIGKRYPGASIEIRVPPFSAVQVGFGTGSRHTRGTPPNVVEMSPEVFIRQITGHLPWEKADVRASGSHAHEAAAVFPL